MGSIRGEGGAGGGLHGFDSTRSLCSRQALFARHPCRVSGGGGTNARRLAVETLVAGGNPGGDGGAQLVVGVLSSQQPGLVERGEQGRLADDEALELGAGHGGDEHAQTVQDAPEGVKLYWSLWLSRSYCAATRCGCRAAR